MRFQQAQVFVLLWCHGDELLLIVRLKLLKRGNRGVLKSEICIFAAELNDAVNQRLRSVLALRIAHNLDKIEVNINVRICQMFHGDDVMMKAERAARPNSSPCAKSVNFILLPFCQPE